MKIRLKALIRVVLLLCLFQATQAEQVNKHGKQLVAEPAVQKQLSQTVSILLNHWKKQASEEDALKAIEELKNTWPIADILPQFILYRVSIMGNEQKYHATIIIGDFLIRDVSDTKLLEVLTPYLECNNPVIYEEIDGMLGSLPSRHGDITGDYYRSFELYLKARKDNPPMALVNYMYSRMPDEAFKTLVRSLLKDSPEKTKLIESAEKMIADQKRRSHKSAVCQASVDMDVANTLSGISKRSEWWVKLYVAEKMKKNPKLRDPELIEQLKKSPHAVVRESIQELN